MESHVHGAEYFELWGNVKEEGTSRRKELFYTYVDTKRRFWGGSLLDLGGRFYFKRPQVGNESKQRRLGVHITKRKERASL